MEKDNSPKTAVWPVDATKLGKVTVMPNDSDLLGELIIEPDSQSEDAQLILKAADKLRHSEVPVAFPTETVYGLGADATRSEAVKGIYRAKQRPADNPLIVHIASLGQLRKLLQPSSLGVVSAHADPIPEIYHSLIRSFWPGPLTIILPNPRNGTLAHEVTAGLENFGARMPRNVLALALIKLSDKPIAAPSANASTKPSPTAAEHVLYDLDGRIETIIDGGPCTVGVESTVVDGLSDPPSILRPGGISLDQLRECPGWERTEIGYKDTSEKGTKPKAPGMKYRHYAPKATVMLFERGEQIAKANATLRSSRKIGVVRTKTWKVQQNRETLYIVQDESAMHRSLPETDMQPGYKGMLAELQNPASNAPQVTYTFGQGDVQTTLVDIQLGPRTSDIARGIFSALRDLDRQDVDTILVEGVSDDEGDVAAAVMNRLRKAAEVKVEG
ncbi:hypothetical protein MBLNU230_g7125t1 [Neophaeotheca triangularis]